MSRLALYIHFFICHSLYCIGWSGISSLSWYLYSPSLVISLPILHILPTADELYFTSVTHKEPEIVFPLCSCRHQLLSTSVDLFYQSLAFGFFSVYLFYVRLYPQINCLFLKICTCTDKQNVLLIFSLTGEPFCWHVTFIETTVKSSHPVAF